MRRTTGILIPMVCAICLIVSSALLLFASTPVPKLGVDPVTKNSEVFQGGQTHLLAEVVQNDSALLAQLEGARLEIHSLRQALAEATEAREQFEHARNSSAADARQEQDKGNAEQVTGECASGVSVVDPGETWTAQGLPTVITVQQIKSEEELQEERVARNIAMGVDDWVAGQLDEIEATYAERLAQIGEEIEAGMLSAEEGERLMTDAKDEAGALVDSLGLNYQQLEIYMCHGGIGGIPQNVGMIVAVASGAEPEEVESVLRDESLTLPKDSSDGRSSETLRSRIGHS